MKGHVEFVAIAEILAHVLRPLVGLASSICARGNVASSAAELFEEGMRLGQVFAVGALALEEVGTASSRKPSTPRSSQKCITLSISAAHRGLSKFRSGWWSKSDASSICLVSIPGPVGFLGIAKMMRASGISGRYRSRRNSRGLEELGVGTAGALEPGVLVGGVVDHQVGDDPQAAPLGFLDEAAEVLSVPKPGLMSP